MIFAGIEETYKNAMLELNPFKNGVYICAEKQLGDVVDIQNYIYIKTTVHSGARLLCFICGNIRNYIV